MIIVIFHYMITKLTFQPEYISSRSNPLVMRYSKLADKKYRTEFGLFLSEGEKLASEAADYASVEAILFSEAALGSASEALIAIIEKTVSKGARPILLTNEAFAKISTEHSPQGIISVVRASSIKANLLTLDMLPISERALMLDSIRDPGNLGTIIRSAAAFGCNYVILNNCAGLTNPKTVRASMGALYKLNFVTSYASAENVRVLKKSGRRVLAAALADESLVLGHDEVLPTDVVIIGNEGHGVSSDLIGECSAILKIPMAPGTESLNASVAASVILWEQFHNLID